MSQNIILILKHAFVISEQKKLINIKKKKKLITLNSHHSNLKQQTEIIWLLYAKSILVIWTQEIRERKREQHANEEGLGKPATNFISLFLI